jgi:hypothetical protein
MAILIVGLSKSGLKFSSDTEEIRCSPVAVGVAYAPSIAHCRACQRPENKQYPLCQTQISYTGCSKLSIAGLCIVIFLFLQQFAGCFLCCDSETCTMTALALRGL